MSTDRRDYVMFAVDIKDKNIDFYSEENEEKYLPYIEGHKDIEYRIIKDYMSNRYCFFGMVLKDADDYDGFDREPIDISDTLIKIYKNRIQNEYWKLFKEHIEKDDIKLYCFTHWY